MVFFTRVVPRAGATASFRGKLGRPADGACRMVDVPDASLFERLASQDTGGPVETGRRRTRRDATSNASRRGGEKRAHAEGKENSRAHSTVASAHLTPPPLIGFTVSLPSPPATLSVVPPWSTARRTATPPTLVAVPAGLCAHRLSLLHSRMCRPCMRRCRLRAAASRASTDRRRSMSMSPSRRRRNSMHHSSRR